MKSKAILFSILFTLIFPLTSVPQTLVTFPSPQVEFIIGPQLKSGDPSNPAPWFDSNAITRGLDFCNQFPATPPGNTPATGTITLTSGSNIVQGIGTHFLTEVPNNSYFLIASNGTYRQGLYIQSPTSDNEIKLNAAWQKPTVTESYAIGFADSWNPYQEGLNYYDFVQTQYINYYRTGDDRFRECARKVADSWWSSFPIDNGKSTSYENGEGLAPRDASLNGLMLRALDGRPEMWPWIVSYTRQQYDLWIGQRVTYPQLYYGAREGGYMLLFAANLGAAHPDSAIRTEFRDKALNAAVNWYARVQLADGSWRWGDPAWIGNAMQPFHVGILLEGMIAVHRLTGDATVRQSIIKGAEALYLIGYNANKWRGTYYQVGGTWSDGTNCAAGCGDAANPFPPPDPASVRNARQLNATSIHVFGYAYLLTGDAKFKQWGDDMFDATFSGADGYRGWGDSRPKEYGESYRAGGKYLAWRLGSASPTPTPTPTASPTPTPRPTPTPTPLPSPTPATTPDVCTMTLSNPVVPQWGSGKLVVTFTGLTQSGSVRALATSGQVTVDSTPKPVSGTSMITEFWLQAKKKSSSISVSGPCGSKSVMVQVQ